MCRALAILVAALAACSNHDSPGPPRSDLAGSAPAAPVPSARVDENADLSRLDGATIAAIARENGYPKARADEPVGGPKIGTKLENVYLETESGGAISLVTFWKSPSFAYRLGKTGYITVEIVGGEPAALLDAIVEKTPLEKVRRTDIRELLERRGWTEIDNGDAAADGFDIFAKKDGLDVSIDITDLGTGLVTTDERHLLAVETGMGKDTDRKLLRAILGVER